MKNNFQLTEVRKIIEQHLIFSCADDAEDVWLTALSLRINDLIQHDFPKLVSLLYRLDINESGLKQLLKAYPNADAGKIIGELIIERQLQKIKSREAYRQDNAEIDENEKW